MQCVTEGKQPKQWDTFTLPIKGAALVCIDEDVEGMFCPLWMGEQEGGITLHRLSMSKDGVGLCPGLLITHQRIAKPASFGNQPSREIRQDEVDIDAGQPSNQISSRNWVGLYQPLDGERWVHLSGEDI